MRTPVVNPEAEAAVLGAVLLTGRLSLDALTIDLGLRPEHFFDDRRQAVFAAMIGLADRGLEIDTLTVADQLREDGQLEHVGGLEAVDAFAGHAPEAGNSREYGELVLRTSRWESRRRALLAGLAAVEERSEQRFVEAEGQLAAPERAGSRTVSPLAQAEDLCRWLADTGSGDAIPLPFEGLNSLLGEGLLKGDATIVATWTSWGKSVLAQQILRFAASLDAKACIYTNEMSPRFYTLRAVCDLTGIPYRRLTNRQSLSNDERERVVKALNDGLKVPIQPVSDWSAKEISRHVRRSKWDIVAVDLVHRIPHNGVEELNAISSTLNNMALQADCHVLLLCQLNNERDKGAKKPRPVKRDVRGTGQLVNDAANVLLIDREQDEVQGTGMFRLASPGSLYFDKARNGALGGVPVWFDNRRMKFVEEEIL